MPKHDDDRIDAMMRAAASRPVDEALLTTQVLARIHKDRIRAQTAPSLLAFPSFSGPGRFAQAAFAIVLMATPFAVSRYPGEATDAVIAALAMGDPMLLGPDNALFFGQGRLE